MGSHKRLKILHLLSQRPDSTGSGIYLQAMLREAVACNHNNFLVTGIQSDNSTAFNFIDPNQCMFVKFYNADISYPIVGMSDVMPYKSTRFRDLATDEIQEYEYAFSKILREAVTNYSPDLIHSHHLWILTSLARKMFPEIPIVTTCHGSDLRQFQICPQLQQNVLSGCQQLNAVIALSEIQKKEILNLYKLNPEDIFVVGSGYNDQLFSQNSKPDPNPVQIIYAGKLSNAKGVPWLLRALSKIDSPAWQIHLVGDGSGEEKEKCLKLVRKLGGCAVVHGNVQQTDLADIMRKTHILVLPSFYEGMPLVLLEGLASGCRIVATNLPGVNELLGDIKVDYIKLVKTPRLFHLDQPYNKDEEAFEKNLNHALHSQIIAAHKDPQINLLSLQDKLTSFSWKNIFYKVQRVYFRVIKSKNQLTLKR